MLRILLVLVFVFIFLFFYLFLLLLLFFVVVVFCCFCSCYCCSCSCYQSFSMQVLRAYCEIPRKYASDAFVNVPIDHVAPTIVVVWNSICGTVGRTWMLDEKGVANSGGSDITSFRRWNSVSHKILKNNFKLWFL